VTSSESGKPFTQVLTKSSGMLTFEPLDLPGRAQVKRWPASGDCFSFHRVSRCGSLIIFQLRKSTNSRPSAYRPPVTGWPLSAGPMHWVVTPRSLDFDVLITAATIEAPAAIMAITVGTTTVFHLSLRWTSRSCS